MPKPRNDQDIAELLTTINAKISEAKQTQDIVAKLIMLETLDELLRDEGYRVGEDAARAGQNRYYRDILLSAGVSGVIGGGCIFALGLVGAAAMPFIALPVLATTFFAMNVSTEEDEKRFKERSSGYSKAIEEKREEVHALLSDHFEKNVEFIQNSETYQLNLANRKSLYARDIFNLRVQHALNKKGAVKSDNKPRM